MIAPFIAIYLFNWLIYLIIIGSLLRRNFKDFNAKTDKELIFVRNQVIIAIVLSFFFGLEWGIGLFATQDIYTEKRIRDVVTAFFVIFSTFHGLFILILRCLRSKDVRSLWKKWFLNVAGRHINLSSPRTSQKYSIQNPAYTHGGTLESTNVFSRNTPQINVSFFGDTSRRQEKYRHSENLDVDIMKKQQTLIPIVVITPADADIKAEKENDDALVESTFINPDCDEDDEICENEFEI